MFGSLCVDVELIKDCMFGQIRGFYCSSLISTTPD
jgi:hypothetical protein